MAFKHLVRGFTLIELLVVISIVSVLLAILFPALASSRENARRVLCSNNIKQVNLASEAYAAERKGFVNRSLHNYGLDPYIDRVKFYNKGCPSWGEAEFANATGWYGRSIGMNTIIEGSWSWTAWDLRQDHFNKPYRTMHLGDSSYKEVGSDNWIPTEERTILRGRHKGDGLNMVFFDGHSEFLKPGIAVGTTTPNAEWRYYTLSCMSPGGATAPFKCPNRGCFWHPF
jgi:prepilin-type N-terminal cleavage/methylation domain-containing protein/prepilin-type processing-associated H-X9-DG protein